MKRIATIRRVAMLLPLFFAATTASASQISFVDGASTPVERDAAGKLPDHFETQVLFAEGTKPEDVHLQLVRATLDNRSVSLGNYSLCLAAPEAGRRLWALRVAWTAGPPKPGRHKLHIVTWQAAGASGASKCESTGARDMPPPPQGAGCTGAVCSLVKLDLIIPAPPGPTGPLLRRLSSGKHTLQFDSKGLAKPDTIAMLAGIGVDFKQLRAVIVDLRRDGADARGDFELCIMPRGGDETNFFDLRMKPTASDLRVGTYSLTAHFWLAPESYGEGSLCGAPEPKYGPALDPTKCKAQPTPKEALDCQSLTFEIGRKAPQLQVTKDIVIDVETIPFLELIRIPRLGRYWELRNSHTPITIDEIGHEGAVELSKATIEASLLESGSADPKGTLTLAPKETKLAPGGSVAVNVETELPRGYGDYISKAILNLRLAVAPAQEISFKVRIRMVPIAMAIAIAIGVFVGYLWRRSFRHGLERDQALIAARGVLDKIDKARREARDSILIEKLKSAREEFQRQIQSLDSTGESITAAMGIAKESLEEALSNLATRSDAAGTELTPWIRALIRRSEEPPDIEKALSGLRNRLTDLRSKLDTGDADSLQASDALPDIPNRAVAALNGVKDWLALNHMHVTQTANQWAALKSSDIDAVASHVDSARAAMAKAVGTSPVTAVDCGAALAALDTVLWDHRVILRGTMAGKAENIGVGLTEFARDQEVDATALRQASDAFAKIAHDAEETWALERFADLAARLNREIEQVLDALKEDALKHKDALKQKKGALTPGELDLLSKDRHIALVKKMLDDNRISGVGADQETAKEEPLKASPTDYKIVCPDDLYIGENQLWRIAPTTSKPPLIQDVIWTVNDTRLAQGTATYLTLTGEGMVEVKARIITEDGKSGEITRTVEPMRRFIIEDIETLRKRVKSRLFWRAMINGVLITIIGYAFLKTTAIGYPGLVAALVWGLTADISADRLTDITSKATS